MLKSSSNNNRLFSTSLTSDTLHKGMTNSIDRVRVVMPKAFVAFTPTLRSRLSVKTMTEVCVQFQEYSTKGSVGQWIPSMKDNTLITSASAALYGFISGIQGVVQQPVRGAEAEGVKGFFEGVGKGILGLALKPVAGALDAVKHT
eukprot:Platyproteum_vivax@DN2911_c0_g1_i2.p2